MEGSPYPEKYFYSIGDVCKLTGTKPHVLRYWEGQFKLLRPARRYSGHRKYTQREVDIINRIRYLIIERKFTLAGAKKEITRQISGKSEQKKMVPAALGGNQQALRDLKRDIDECLHILKNHSSSQPELLKI